MSAKGLKNKIFWENCDIEIIIIQSWSEFITQSSQFRLFLIFNNTFSSSEEYTSPRLCIHELWFLIIIQCDILLSLHQLKRVQTITIDINLPLSEY